MPEGTILYKTAKMGSCGSRRKDISFPIPDSYTLDNIQEDINEVMAEYEAGTSDGWKYIVTFDNGDIYEVYKKDDIWFYKLNGNIVNSTKDYTTLFTEV